MNIMSFDPIGKIKINNIYEYYDEPLVFSFYSGLGTLFLANLVDINEDEVYSWTYLPVTTKEIYDLENNSESLYSLYKKSTSNFVYICKEDSENKVYSMIKMSEFPDEYLPDEESYVELLDGKDENLTDIELITDQTIKSNRYVVDLSLEVNNTHDHEIDASLLGNTLINFQELVQTVGGSSELSKQASVSDVIKIENKLKVTKTYAASFGIRMESREIANLFYDDPIKDNMEKVIRMFDGVDDFEKSLIELSNYSEKSKFKFLSILKIFCENKVNGNITLGIPQGNDVKVVSTRFEENNIKEYYKSANSRFVISHKELELDGTLLAFDSKNSTFKFASKESDYDVIYNGKLSEKITDSTSYIPKDGVAKILIEIKTKLFTGEETQKYTLQMWNPS